MNTDLIFKQSEIQILNIHSFHENQNLEMNNYAVQNEHRAGWKKL